MESDAVIRRRCVLDSHKRRFSEGNNRATDRRQSSSSFPRSASFNFSGKSAAEEVGRYVPVIVAGDGGNLATAHRKCAIAKRRGFGEKVARMNLSVIRDLLKDCGHPRLFYADARTRMFNPMMISPDEQYY